jgi:hypothetical protein
MVGFSILKTGPHTFETDPLDGDTTRKMFGYYMYTMIAAAIMFVSYLFIEMIARPLLAIAL